MIQHSRPTISLIIPAFNEEEWIGEKIRNSLMLYYPSDLIEVIVVTDGSDDRSAEIAQTFEPTVKVLHQAERRGKIHAMNRAAAASVHDILVFTDTNTQVNEQALHYIAACFEDPLTGMVSGEKKVTSREEKDSAAGEGLYWRYESWLKRLDSEASSVIGAAGELFAIRKELFEALPEDTLLDDFMLSSQVLKKGYRVAYEPKACASELGSASYLAEWKRKVRICAGGMQSVIRSRALFNIRKYGIRSFSFTVHRVFRWTVAPAALIISYILSALLFFQHPVYMAYFILMSAFSLFTLWVVHSNKRDIPKVLLPGVYFIFMHASAVAGWIRYLSKKQTVNWERAERLT